jgi:macrocin-O-methyltransferase TylF-like protien
MIPLPTYVSNLRLAARIEGVPGSVVECGTWRRGMIAGIADVLGSIRRYYLFDSFEGLDPAKEIDRADALAWQRNPSAPKYHDNCAASEDEAREAMSKSSAGDCRIFKGCSSPRCLKWIPLKKSPCSEWTQTQPSAFATISATASLRVGSSLWMTTTFGKVVLWR